MKISSIATIAVFTAGFAFAVEDAPAKPVSHSAAEQEGKPIGTPVETSGKIVSVHSCPMVGVPAPHMVVKIETEQGDTDIVDLGSAEELKTNGFEPKEGKQVWVDGRVGKINDKFLIVAERLTESKLMQISRTDGLTEETVKHANAGQAGKDGAAVPVANDRKDVNPSQVREEHKDGTAGQVVNDRNEANQGKTNNDGRAPQAPKTETVAANQTPRTVEGTVMQTRRVRIEGEAEEHVLAKLQTQSGVAVVDLGVNASIPAAVGICEGRMLSVTGVVGQLNGKPIIVSSSVSNTSAGTPATTTATPTK